MFLHLMNARMMSPSELVSNEVSLSVPSHGRKTKRSCQICSIHESRDSIITPLTSFFCIVMIIIFIWNQISLCSPGYLGAQYIDQAALEFTKIFLLLPWRANIKSVHHCQAIPLNNVALEIKFQHEFLRRQKHLNQSIICLTFNFLLVITSHIIPSTTQQSRQSCLILQSILPMIL